MTRGRATTPACVALVGGLVALAVGVAVTLSHASVRLAGSNDVEASAILRVIPAAGGRWCQAGELLPGGTASARLWLQPRGLPGPSVRVTALVAGRPIATATHAAGWSERPLTVALAPTVRHDTRAQVCVALAPGAPVAVVGSPPSREAAGQTIPARMRIEYLRPGRTSWWAFVPTIVARLGRGHAWSGPALALTIAALTLAAAVLSLRELLRPHAAWLCALVGLLNAAAWSLVIPPFQLPDEPAQYAYAEHIAQTGAPPAEQTPTFERLDISADEKVALRDLRANEISGHAANAGMWSPLEQRTLVRDLNAGPSRSAGGYSYGAAPQPPLYYALAAIPYAAASGATILQRVALMRLFSALLGGLTVLFTYLFLREALPNGPWTWTVGALGVALHPMFASLTSGVNPDALLFCVSAALFWCVARAFRHGVTRRLALATGTAIAIGLTGKLNVVGLLPGTILAIALVALRQQRTPSTRAVGGALRLPALALAVAAVPVAIVAALNVLAWRRPAIGLISTNGGSLSHGTLWYRLSYLWQTLLPPLPGMQTIYPYAPTHLYFNEFVGSFGGLDTHFPHWFEHVALVLVAILVALALRGLVSVRRSAGRRRAELLCYLLMLGGMLAVIGAQYYSLDARLGNVGEFVQLRYLLVLAPLYGALLVLAARGAGRRLLPLAGTLIVVVALAHDVLSQLLAIGRYYA